MQKTLITWPDGKPRQSYSVNILGGGEGQVREYHPSGRLRALGRVNAFLQQGMWKYFHPDGQRCAAGMFRDGMPSGRWIYYNEDHEYRGVHWEVVRRGSFRLSLPQGWQTREQDGHLLHCVETRGKSDSPWISVSHHRIGVEMGIRDFTMQLLTRSEKSLRSMHFRIEEMEPRKIRNLDACLALTTVSRGNQRLYTRMAFIKDGKELYKVQAVCAESGWARYRILFEECLHSFLLSRSNTPLTGLHLIYPPDPDETASEMLQAKSSG